MRRWGLVAALIGAACGDSETGRSGMRDDCGTLVEGELPIGAISFYEKPDGLDPEMHGAKLAVQEINQAGGIRGRTLGLVVCNETGDPSVDREAMQWLVANHPVGAVVGPSRSVVALGNSEGPGIAELAAKEQVVLISPSATSPMLASMEDDDYVFRTTVSDAVQGLVLARIAQREGFERILVLQAEDDPYTLGIRQRFSTAMEEAGSKAEVTYLEFGASDRPSYLLSAIDDAGATAVLLAAFPEQVVDFLTAAKSHPFRAGMPAWLLPDGLKHEDALPQLVPLAEMTAPIFGTAPANPTGAAYREFARNHRRVLGVEAGTFGAQGYDAVYLIAAAMQLAEDPTRGSELRDALHMTQPGSGSAILGPNQWPEIRQVLELEGGFDYRGASGEQDFDAAGDVLSGIAEWAIENGAFTHKRCWTASGERC
jgi:branched-chain amino acid transport system substrate-binding protein